MTDRDFPQAEQESAVNTAAQDIRPTPPTPPTPTQELATAMSAALDLKEFKETEETLAKLRHQYKDVVFDCATTEGDKQARAARMELVKLRTGMDAAKKKYKAPVIALGRKIDDQYNKIYAEITAVEKPIDDQIKAREAAVEAERARKAAEAQVRRDKMVARLTGMREFPLKYIGKTVEEIRAGITFVEAVRLTDKDFDETYLPLAVQAQKDVLAKLGQMVRERIDLDEREAANRAAQEELLEQRRVDEARRAEEDAKAAEARAEADRAAEAERQRIADEQAAAFEAERAAFRKEQDERDRQHEANRAALRAQQAEMDRKTEEARQALAREQEKQREFELANADLAPAAHGVMQWAERNDFGHEHEFMVLAAALKRSEERNETA